MVSSRRVGSDNVAVSGDDTLNISTEALAQASAEAAATESASASTAIVPPAPTSVSKLDGALTVLSTAMEATRAGLDRTDATWAQKQTQALSESPPELQNQDVDNAEKIGETQRRFPMPVVVPGAPGGTAHI